MPYRAMADLIVAFHFATVIFVVTGGLLVLWRRRVAWVHLPVVAWVVFAECFHKICPLTFVENYLRDRGAQETYQGDFVAHYIVPVLYPNGLTPRIQIVLGIAVFAINATLYTLAFRRKPGVTAPARDSADAYLGAEAE